MEKVLQNELINLSEVEPRSLDQLDESIPSTNDGMLIHEGSASGGYAHYVFAKAVKELFAENLTNIQFKVVRLG